MKIFDPHCHMVSRVTDDYEKMALAGVRAVVEPAFWLGEPRKRTRTARATTNVQVIKGASVQLKRF